MPVTKSEANYGSRSDCYSMKGINYSNTNQLIIEAIRTSPPLKQKIAPRCLFEAEVTAFEARNVLLFHWTQGVRRMKIETTTTRKDGPVVS